MKPARTTSSVNLRRGPAKQYKSIDELEKHYPLIVHNKVDGWCRVTAKAQGLRLKDQEGYIDSRFVELLPVIVADEPKDDPPRRRFLRDRIAVALLLFGLALLAALWAWG